MYVFICWGCLLLEVTLASNNLFKYALYSYYLALSCF